MVVTPAAGWMIDPNNPNGVIQNAPPPITGGATNNADPSKAGNAGYDVFGNIAKSAQLPGSPPVGQQPANTPITPPAQPPKPVTAFSSDTANQYISDNTQKLQTLKNTGLTLGPDGLARFSDMSFATAPSDAVQNEDGTWQSGGVKYAMGPATSEDPELKAMNDQITQMKTQFDSTSRAQIDNIKQQFDTLIRQQGDINKRSEASLNQSLLMGGSSRYAQESSNGQVTALMSYGLQQLSDLNTKEQTAVLQAQAAQDSGDMQLMDKSLQIAKDARDQKQAAAKDLSDKLVKANDDLKATQQQNKIDSAIGAQLTAGVSDPAAIVAALATQGITTTAKAVNDSIANLNPDAKEIANVLGDASKFGAPQDVLSKIGGARTLSEAYAAAGKYLQDPTSNAGMYNAYVAKTTASGGTPVSAEKFLETNKANEAYAVKSAQNQADTTNGDKTQNALEQQYRQVLLKEVSNRSGGIGLQDQKVNQAIHLKTLIDQYKDANGNYNIPTAQYYELVFGLANLVSPNGTTAESDRRELASKTASGDLKGALQYVTGVPQNGNTQAIIKNLVDSIDRQGGVSEDLRDQGVQFLHSLAPTDLDQSRIDQLEKGTLASFRNPPQDPLTKATADESAAANDIKAFDAESPENAKRVDDLHTQFPTASATDIKAALGI